MIDFFIHSATAAEDAAKVVLNVPIGQVSSVSSLAEYFQIWYSFVIGSIGILATVMVMWGGFKWLTSRGNSAVIGEAKERIISALIGLALVFLSYTILETINPRLVNLSMPGLKTETYVEDEHLNPRTPAPPTLVGANVVDGKEIDPDLKGRQDLVTTAQTLKNDLTTKGKLPPGFDITSSYRPEDIGSQHAAGNAFDVTWPTINEQEAQAFAANVMASNPDLSIIIERRGQPNGKGWKNGWGGIHIDKRPGKPYISL